MKRAYLVHQFVSPKPWDTERRRLLIKPNAHDVAWTAEELTAFFRLYEGAALGPHEFAIETLYDGPTSTA